MRGVVRLVLVTLMASPRPGRAEYKEVVRHFGVNRDFVSVRYSK